MQAVKSTDTPVDCLQVYLPDDDIIQTGAIINTIFDVQQQYHLDLCQPSLCSETESFTWAR